jgi:Ni,Fe-hydrogenase III component G
MLQSAVSLHVVAEFFDVCALYLPEMKKKGSGLLAAIGDMCLRLNQRYSVHMFLVNVGSEMKNDGIITKRISGFIIIQSEPTAQETYQNRIKIGHQPQRVHVNHYHHQSVKLNLLVKTAGVRMGGREGGPISGCYATAP